MATGSTGPTGLDGATGPTGADSIVTGPLQVSDDAVNFVNVGSPVTAVASSTVVTTVADMPVMYIRAIETTGGDGATAGYICIRGQP